MKVLVTGANGFLGSHIVKQLNATKHTVRAFLLNGTSEATLGGLHYEPFFGDLTDESDIDNAIKDCDVIIHTAAVTDVWPTKNKFSWIINYEVVKKIAVAAQKYKIQKFVHVGTANSFGFGTKRQPGTEDSPFNGSKYRLDYMNSKKAAQDYLLSQVRENNLPVTILNPSFMIGDNDQKPGTGEMILSVIHQKVPGYAKGGRCFAAVKDVAVACVNAIEKGKVGECYIVGGENLNYQEFFTMVATIANVRPPKRYIPSLISVVFAGLLEFFATITKKQPLLTIAMAKISSDGHYYSSEKAIRELNYPQTPLNTALIEAIQWYKENGYVQERSSQ
jgi:dihydroflavonol-4-reductase